MTLEVQKKTYIINVYKLFNCEDTEDVNIYVGSTKRAITRRFRDHKNACNSNMTQLVYEYIRTVGGITCFKCVLIKSYEVTSRSEQLQKEQIHIDELKPTLNSKNAFLSPEKKKVMKAIIDKLYRERHSEQLGIKHKEYYLENKEHIDKYQKKYQVEHKEHLKDYIANWYEENKEEQNKKNREYYQNTIEDRRAYDKNRYQNDPKRKAALKKRADVKYMCEVCNKELTLVKKKRHEQTKSHLDKIPK